MWIIKVYKLRRGNRFNLHPATPVKIECAHNMLDRSSIQKHPITTL